MSLLYLLGRIEAILFKFICSQAMQELVTLPPHLIEKIQAILAADLDIPSDLRAKLQASLDQPIPEPIPSEEGEHEHGAEDAGSGSEGAAQPQVPNTKAKPPTIDISILERLSRWACSDTTSQSIKSKRSNIDPTEYGMIPLLSGTELYIPPSQLPHILSSETTVNPYLPSYLSPLPPSFGQEYRSLTRQLSTVLNILFSIFGSAFAVYVAATTGGGYSREKGILMGVLAGVVVGVADGVLVLIFGKRVKEGREEGRKMAIKLAKGSAGEGVKAIEGDADGQREAIETTKSDNGTEEASEKTIEPIKKDIRLRRRAIGDKAGNP
jgi:gas vesicle protein